MHREKRKLLKVGLLLILVVSITALFLSVLKNNPAQAYNTRTITQLQQYIHALELVYLDDGQYPGDEEFVCLGDYSDDRCWENGGTGKSEDIEVNKKLSRYLPLLPAGNMVMSESFPDQSREGYIYRQLRGGNGYEIQYFLSGKDKNCGFGETISVSSESATHYENTWCHIIR